MQTKSLQTKRALRAALLVLMLSVAGMGKGYAYDFSAVCSTGQTLYYKITDASNHYVRLTCPNDNYNDPWGGYVEPTGIIILPSNVTNNGTNYIITGIDHHAFYFCSGLIGNLTIPNSVTVIGTSAFAGCSGLTGSLTIPDFVTTVSDFAFTGCCGFTGSLTIGESVTTIGMRAFADCSGFTGDLTIGNSVSSIYSEDYPGHGAFSGCEGFSGTLTIGESLHSVPPVDITRFSQIIVSLGNTEFDSRDNSNAIIRTRDNTLVRGCKNTVIPNSVTTIGELAFYNCTGLTGELIIPNSVVKIEDAVATSYGSYFTHGVFENCTG